jgi:multidrug resistance protein, MATE family
MIASRKKNLRELVNLAAPIALVQLGLNGMSLVDTAVVGNHSTRAFAGASLGRALVFTVLSIGIGIGMSLEALASQAVSAGEPDRAWKSTISALRACALQFPLAAAAAYGLSFVLPLLHADAEDVAGARQFLLGNFPAIFFFAAFIAAKTFLQAHERIAPLAVAVLIANVVNWIVVNLLVRGDQALLSIGLPAQGLPQLGPLGAGIANTVGSMVLFLVAMAYAYPLRADGPNAAPSVKRILEIGTPMGLQFLAEIGAFTTASMLAVWFGDVQVAAYQVALLLASQTFMGALGVSGATAVQVGHAIGRGESARDHGMLGIAVGAAFMLIGVFLFLVFPEALVALFTKDPAVRTLGVRLLHIAAIFQLFDGVQVVAAGALRGAGDAKWPFFLNLIGHWGFGLPVALALGFGAGWGAYGFTCGLTVGLAMVALMMSVRFERLSRSIIARTR